MVGGCGGDFACCVLAFVGAWGVSGALGEWEQHKIICLLSLARARVCWLCVGVCGGFWRGRGLGESVLAFVGALGVSVLIVCWRLWGLLA